MNQPISPQWMEEQRRQLVATGWLYLPSFQPEPDGGARALAFARLLGPSFRTSDMDLDRPVIVTSPSASADTYEPFNQLPGIGWHNDFSTHRVRPRWSLSYIDRGEVGGGEWRVADVRQVAAKLRQRPGVLRALRKRMPFCFFEGGPICWFRPLTRDGLRFYGRTLREGARGAYDRVPEEIGEAVDAVEQAADEVGMTLPATSGALLVVDNCWTLHDRLPQSPGERRAILTFVESAHAS